jgi:hypothetical protein
MPGLLVYPHAPSPAPYLIKPDHIQSSQTMNQIDIEYLHVLIRMIRGLRRTNSKSREPVSGEFFVLASEFGEGRKNSPIPKRLVHHEAFALFNLRLFMRIKRFVVLALSVGREARSCQTNFCRYYLCILFPIMKPSIPFPAPELFTISPTSSKGRETPRAPSHTVGNVISSNGAATAGGAILESTTISSKWSMNISNQPTRNFPTSNFPANVPS